MKTPPPENEWPVSWEANERARLRDNLKLTFRQKMQWLEDMSDFAKKLQSAPTRTWQEVQAAYAQENARKEPASQPENTSA